MNIKPYRHRPVAGARLVPRTGQACMPKPRSSTLRAEGYRGQFEAETLRRARDDGCILAEDQAEPENDSGS
jgi:hypothetical protein